jgi:thioredoxin reductase
MAASAAEISTEVAIVGSGPAGLAAAAQLARDGITDILIIERDDALGGLPRFCDHLGFGWEYSRRLDTGPRFVRRLVHELPRTARILLRTTALRVSPGPMVKIVGPETGFASISAKAVLIATGIREQSRGGRLVPGTRPEQGILTTGLLQQLVHRGVAIEHGRMVVVGSEHVAFSAILTGRRAGLRTVAMVESQVRPQSWPLAAFIARAMGTEMLLGTQVLEVLGRDRVESVVVRDHGREVQTIACDYVLFSGGWIPESLLVSDSGGQLDEKAGGPIVDQFLRTTIPAVFAAGNVLRPVESSGRVALEGAFAARSIAALLAQQISPEIGNIKIEVRSPLSYVVPQRWAPERLQSTVVRFSSRSSVDGRGKFVVCVDGVPGSQSARKRFHAGRQLRFALKGLDLGSTIEQLDVSLQPAQQHSEG